MANNTQIIQSTLVEKSALGLVETLKKVNFSQYELETGLLINEVKYLQDKWNSQRLQLRTLLQDEYSDWSHFGKYQKLRDDLLKSEDIKKVLLQANLFIDEVRQLFFGEEGKIYFVYGREVGRGQAKHIEEYKMTIAEAIEMSTITLDSKTRQLKLRLSPSLKILQQNKIGNKIEQLDNSNYQIFSAIQRYVAEVLKERKVAGPVYETYRNYITQKKVLNLKTKAGRKEFEKIYQFSKNSISALKGGDVDNEQIKTVGGTFSLTTTLINELTDIQKMFKEIQKSNTVTSAKKVVTNTLLKDKKDLVTKIEKESRERAIEYLDNFLLQQM